MSANDDDDMEEEQEEVELPDPGEGMPYYELGFGRSSVDSPVGSGESFHALNATVTINGVRFGTDLDADHGIGLQFLSGLSPGTIADDHLGLFLFSDTPFEGSEEAGFFEGSGVSFEIGGREVVIANGVDTLSILGNGARKPVHARHLADFRWRGIDVAAGFSPDVSYILNRSSHPWGLNLKNLAIDRNGIPVVRSGSGVGQEPFGYLYTWFGANISETGMVIISSRPFDQAEALGTFAGSELYFMLGGDEYLYVSETDTLLGDGGPTTAYVYNDPGFVLEQNSGEPVAGVAVGISSDLASILEQDASGR